MHFGQKDTEDDSVRITIFWQVRPLHLKGVSFFTFPSSLSFSSDSTFVSEEDKDEDEADAAAASSLIPSPFSFTTFADDDAVEVARVVDEAVGMGGGKSSSSPAPRPPPTSFTVADFAADDIFKI